MKHVRKSLVLLTIAIASLAILFSQPISAKEKVIMSTTVKEKMREVTVKFSKDTVIEVAFVSIKNGKQNQLFGDYFAKVTPIGAEYHAGAIGMFSVVDAAMGQTSPQIVGLFKWPDVETFLKFHKDKRYLAVEGIRNDALSYLSNGHFFVVQKDTDVTFKEGVSYQISARWLRDNSSAKDGGVQEKQLASLIPVGMSKTSSDAVGQACRLSQDHNYSPSTFDILPWPSASATSISVQATEDYSATNRLDIIQVKFNFPPEA